MDKTEITIRMILQTMTSQESELALPKKERDLNVMLQIGPHSIGNLSLVMEEKSKTLEKDLEKDKSQDLMLLQSEADNLSTVSILHSHNSMKVIRPFLSAHHTTHMEVLTPFLHSATLLSHLTQMSPLRSKCLSAVSPHTLKTQPSSFNHIPQPCNQTNVLFSDHITNKEAEIPISFFQLSHMKEMMTSDNFPSNTTKSMTRISNGTMMRNTERFIMMPTQTSELMLMPEKREELSSLKETMPTTSKEISITPHSINFLHLKDSHSLLITTLTTSLMLVLPEDQVENTVVSHNTGTLNTARVNHKLKHGKISVTRRVMPPNTGSSVTLKPLRMVTIPPSLQRAQQVSSLATNNLISKLQDPLTTPSRTEHSHIATSEASGMLN